MLRLWVTKSADSRQKKGGWLPSEHDQIVSIDVAARLSSKIVKGPMLKVYSSAPHGLCSTHKDHVDEHLIALFKVCASG